MRRSTVLALLVTVFVAWILSPWVYGQPAFSHRVPRFLHCPIARLGFDFKTFTFKCSSAMVPVEFYSGVDCSGNTASDAGLQTAVNALNPNGQTLEIPSNCVLRFPSPASNNTACTANGVPNPCCTGAGTGTCFGPAFKFPNNVHIYCQDQSAGFAPVRQKCIGGNYPNAACNTSAECTGGGVCSFDFGSSTFAPGASPNAYTLAGDAGPGTASSHITIENCSFFMSQTDGYQRCVGGTKAGNPCRQECSIAATNAGARCESNADCPSGVCLNTADCAGAGGTCTGAPVSPIGNAEAQTNVTALDLSNTFNALLYHVSVWDAFTGNRGIALGDSATTFDVRVGREQNDCTVPINYPTGRSPSNSQCLAGSTGKCCYGAAYNTSAAGQKFNTQPTTNLTVGLSAGNDAQIIRTFSRGVTAFTSLSRSRFDECFVVPYLLASDGSFNNLGPGTVSTNGYDLSAGTLSQVTKSFDFDNAGSGVAIKLGADSGAVADKLFLNSVYGANGTGILMTGDDSHAMGNNVKGVNGSGFGIDINGANNSSAQTNFVSGNAATGGGIRATGIVVQDSIEGNQVVSNPVNTMQTGIIVDGVSLFGGRAQGFPVTGNTVSFMQRANIELRGFAANGIPITGNTSLLPLIGPNNTGGGSPVLSGTFCTQSYHPIHIYDSQSNTQGKAIAANYMQGGCKGIFVDPARNGLVNAGINGNRYYQVGGQPVTVWGAAGVEENENYVNSVGQGWTTSCDPSCDTTHRGFPCNQDSDCGTCTAANSCVPDALWTDIAAQHHSGAHNLWFQGTGSPFQCTVAGPIGQICESSGAGGTCAGGATCSTANSNGPSVCQSGGDVGKRCCQTGAGATWAARQQTPGVRFDDIGSGTIARTLMLDNNQMFNLGSNTVAIDLFATAGASTSQLIDSQIKNNLIEPLASVTNFTGIRFPTAYSTTAGQLQGNEVADNNIKPILANIAGATASGTAIVNWQGAIGSLSLVEGHPAVGTFTHIPAATTAANFAPLTGIEDVLTATEADVQEAIPGASTIWKMACATNAAPTGNANRVITFRKGGVSQISMTCTIDATHNPCTPAINTAAAAPIAIPNGSLVDWMMASHLGTGTLPGASASCVAYISHDSAL
jgi:hypothetical protein